MKVALEIKDDQYSKEISEQFRKALEDKNIQISETNPDLVVSIGGDGTFLHAFHRYSKQFSNVHFVGIHTGHLGFYADYLPHEIDQLVESIQEGHPQTVEYPLLEAIIHTTDQEIRHLALNESTLKCTDGTMVIDIEIRGELFETFRGDGLCMSTPSGSTAYNKALGGAIIHPSLKSIQLTEMASINNRVFRTIGSPLVLPSHHNCILKPINRKDFQVTVDHLTFTYKNVREIHFRVAPEIVKFARFRTFPFWKRVRDSFVTPEGK